jgi:hypothetical protein
MRYTFRIILVLVSCMLVFSSCKQTTIVKTKNPPPGQVKKATGSKSAAPYAPGQQNKSKGKEKKGNK